MVEYHFYFKRLLIRVLNNFYFYVKISYFFNDI